MNDQINAVATPVTRAVVALFLGLLGEALSRAKAAGRNTYRSAASTPPASVAG